MGSTKDRRARATGRLGVREGERYALVPEEVMRSTAYAAQPDFAKAVLFAVACRFGGHNNGNLSLPFSEARDLGIAYQRKLYAGLPLLRKAGLVAMTRQGKLERGTKVCSLYAITWRAINRAPDGVSYDAGILPSVVPTNDWAKWEQPTDWAQIVRQKSRAHHGQIRSPTVGATTKINPVSPTVGAGRSPTVGATMPTIAHPPWVQEGAFIAPTVGETSKTPPPTPRTNGKHRAPRAPHRRR